MEVYKFGGASVKDANGIRNLSNIVGRKNGNLLIVVSALGKTTNDLEKVVTDLVGEKNDYRKDLQAIIDYHSTIISELAGEEDPGIKLEPDLEALYNTVESCKGQEYDYLYDQVVSYGEILSTRIISWWLNRKGIDCCWLDIREVLVTDDRYRDANINWELSKIRVKSFIGKTKERVILTQGFIGATENGATTTLGREGSDFSAGILANILDAESVTVWKDVLGILNADPVWFNETIKLQSISYKEAIELSFSGAKVIHPKTIKPLHNKSIPLFVRSFMDVDDPGTVISVDESLEQDIPLYVKKDKQVLLSLIPKDFSFIIGDHLGELFQIFYQIGIKISLVQTSAISIAVCVDDDSSRLSLLLAKLEGDYKMLTNAGVELITLRYYNSEAINRVLSSREVLLEQRTRRTIRFVLRKLN